APIDYSQTPEIIHVSPRGRFPPAPSTSTDLVTTKTAIYEERYGPPYHHHHHHHRSRSMGPTPRHEEYIESSLALAPIPAFPSRRHRRDEAGQLVLYERDERGVEPVAAVRRDRKGPNPRAVRAMMRFVT
ncbi:hypothetical protein V500_11411, partial [Pseudogymnoascus sp. VKM F-4518 (FW-2643)]